MRNFVLFIFSFSFVTTAAFGRQVCSLRKYEGTNLVYRGPVYLEWDEQKLFNDKIVKTHFVTQREDTVKVTLTDVATNVIVAEAFDYDPWGSGARINFAYVKPGTNLRYEVRCSFGQDNVVRDDCRWGDEH